jgi:16S rRNA U516 pseudouridylate synthase RsuA-like enzyme
VPLDDGITAPAQVKRLRAERDRTLLEIVLHEGRKRQIRRMCQAVGHPVQRLVRIAIGDLRLPRDLKPGQWRALTNAELAQLAPTKRLQPTRNSRRNSHDSSRAGVHKRNGV